jgi:parallel beta-helix repeat protein
MRKGEILGKIFGTTLAVLVIFSICGALPGIVDIEPVSASPGIIYVPDNFTTIQQAVNNAISGDTIIVRDGTYHENVNVNKAGLTIQSENGTANCIVTASNPGDHVFDVTANWVNITGFTVEGATGLYKAGIYLGSAAHCNISSNNARNNSYGIYLWSSSSNTIRDNTANSNDDYGIYLWSSSSNTLRDNTMSGNPYNFGVVGGSLSDYIQDIDTSNKVDGKPIYYWVNHQDEQVPSDAGYVAVVNSTNITVKDLTLTKNGEGVLFAYTEDSRIENVTASNNDKYGIYLWSSSSNTIRDNTANSNGWGIYLWSSSDNTLRDNTANSNGWGIYLWSSSDNTFTNNTANWNNYDGICLRYSSNNNTLANNTASNNTGGISLSVSHNNTLTNNTASSNRLYGINLGLSSNNTFTNNTANSNTYGIWVSGSSNNTLTNNTVSNNTYYGIYLDYSSNNTIYNNYFYFDNTNNARDNGANTWNTTKTSGTNIIGGPYLGGNYWSDYTGNDTNGDGFGDTPYNITGGSNKDYLPLVGTTLEGYVTFPMARVGSLVEPFTVKLFESGNFSNVIWSGNRTTNSTGVFNMTCLIPDTYDIGIKSAICVSEVNYSVALSPGTNVVDFTIRSGDVDNNDYVDMGDYSAFSTAFNTAPSDGKWNANADLDRSGYIDMGDYSMFATYFNELGDAYGQF